MKVRKEIYDKAVNEINGNLGTVIIDLNGALMNAMASGINSEGLNFGFVTVRDGNQHGSIEEKADPVDSDTVITGIDSISLKREAVPAQKRKPENAAAMESLNLRLREDLRDYLTGKEKPSEREASSGGNTQFTGNERGGINTGILDFFIPGNSDALKANYRESGYTAQEERGDFSTGTKNSDINQAEDTIQYLYSGKTTDEQDKDVDVKTGSLQRQDLPDETERVSQVTGQMEEFFSATRNAVSLFERKDIGRRTGSDHEQSGSAVRIDGYRAGGGPVLSGKNYVVGERGPEILRMGNSSGTITPNEATGSSGSIRVVIENVNISAGNSVTSDLILNQVRRALDELAETEFTALSGLM